MLKRLSSLHILEINSLLDSVCKYFLPSCKLSLHFDNHFLGYAEAFWFATITLLNFCFRCLCFCDHMYKNHCPDQCLEAFPPLVSSSGFKDWGFSDPLWIDFACDNEQVMDSQFERSLKTYKQEGHQAPLVSIPSHSSWIALGVKWETLQVPLPWCCKVALDCYPFPFCHQQSWKTH